MTKARDLADLGNKTSLDEINDAYDDGAITGSNMIINGDFSISQRGDYTSASNVSNGVYYLDRWKLHVGLSGTLQDTGYKVKVVATSTAFGVLAISQSIEDKNIHPHKGEVVTVSCKVTSNSSNARIVIYADDWIALGSQNDVHSGGGNEETLSATFTVPSNLSGILQVRVGFENAESNLNPSVSANDYFEVSEVKLEVGDTATPFEHRSYGDELAKCKRYYERYDDTGTGLALCAGMWYDTTTFYGPLLFEVEKRTDPTFSYNTSGSYEAYRAGSFSTTTNVSVTRTTVHGTRIGLQGLSGSGTAGQGAWMEIDGNGYLVFDAEL